MVISSCDGAVAEVAAVVVVAVEVSQGVELWQHEVGEYLLWKRLSVCPMFR